MHLMSTLEFLKRTWFFSLHTIICLDYTYLMMVKMCCSQQVFFFNMLSVILSVQQIPSLHSIHWMFFWESVMKTDFIFITDTGDSIILRKTFLSVCPIWKCDLLPGRTLFLDLFDFSSGVDYRNNRRRHADSSRLDLPHGSAESKSFFF